MAIKKKNWANLCAETTSKKIHRMDVWTEDGFQGVDSVPSSLLLPLLTMDNVSYAMPPSCAVAFSQSAVSVVSPWCFQTLCLSPGAGAARKKKKAVKAGKPARGSSSAVREPESAVQK